MANYGIKLTKAGYDYDDGDRRLIYNSTYPLLKIKAVGAGTLGLSSGAGSKTLYTHSLGYVPFFYVWCTYISTSDGSLVSEYKLLSWSIYAGLQVSDYYDAWATTTTIELNVSTNPSIYGGTGSDTLNYIYVVFYDPLA